MPDALRRTSAQRDSSVASAGICKILTEGAPSSVCILGHPRETKLYLPGF